MVNWNWVSKVYSTNTKVLLSLSRADIIKLTSYNLKSNLMYKYWLHAWMPLSLSNVCINVFLKNSQRFLITWLIFSPCSTSNEEILVYDIIISKNLSPTLIILNQLERGINVIFLYAIRLIDYYFQLWDIPALGEREIMRWYQKQCPIT